MSANWIFWPVILQALVTLYLYVPMFRARVASVKKGTASMSDFRLPSSDEPPETRQKANAVSNQYELPILFFAVVLSAYVTQTVDWGLFVLACLFVGFKTAHSYVHATSNKLRHRLPIFAASLFICILMWLWFAVRLLLA